MRQAWLGPGRAGAHVAAEGKLTPGWVGEDILGRWSQEKEPKVTGVLARAAGRMELLYISKMEKAVSGAGWG